MTDTSLFPRMVNMIKMNAWKTAIFVINVGRYIHQCVMATQVLVSSLGVHPKLRAIGLERGHGNDGPRSLLLAGLPPTYKSASFTWYVRSKGGET